MKILVTGARGVVGRQLVQELSVEARVLAPTAQEMDLASPFWSDNYLPRDIDHIVHVAQHKQYRNFPEEGLSTFAVNTESTARLVDFATRIGARSFTLTSTGGVYAPAKEPVRETLIFSVA